MSLADKVMLVASILIVIAGIAIEFMGYSELGLECAAACCFIMDVICKIINKKTSGKDFKWSVGVAVVWIAIIILEVLNVF